MQEQQLLQVPIFKSIQAFFNIVESVIHTRTRDDQPQESDFFPNRIISWVGI